MELLLTDTEAGADCFRNDEKERGMEGDVGAGDVDQSVAAGEWNWETSGMEAEREKVTNFEQTYQALELELMMRLTSSR